MVWFTLRLEEKAYIWLVPVLLNPQISMGEIAHNRKQRTSRGSIPSTIYFQRLSLEVAIFIEEYQHTNQLNMLPKCCWGI